MDPLRGSTREMRRLAAGRWTLRVYIVAVLMISAATVTAMGITVGPHVLPRGVGRFAMTCILMLCLWRGSRVARWLTVVLMGSAGLATLMITVSASAPGAFAWIWGLMDATYLSLAVLLALPTPVSDFVVYQRLVRELDAAAEEMDVVKRWRSEGQMVEGGGQDEERA